ncbi:hypothetical protein ACLOJK_029193 [Asimina triloba]
MNGNATMDWGCRGGYASSSSRWEVAANRINFSGALAVYDRMVLIDEDAGRWVWMLIGADAAVLSCFHCSMGHQLPAAAVAAVEEEGEGGGELDLAGDGEENRVATTVVAWQTGSAAAMAEEEASTVPPYCWIKIDGRMDAVGKDVGDVVVVGDATAAVAVRIGPIGIDYKNYQTMMLPSGSGMEDDRGWGGRLRLVK